MRLLPFLITLITLYCNAQETLIHNDEDGVKLHTYSKDWKPEDFTDGIREIKVYSYTIKNNRVKRNRVLVKSAIYDSKKNCVSGVQCDRYDYTNPKNLNYLDKYEHQYDSLNRISTVTDEALTPNEETYKEYIEKRLGRDQIMYFYDKAGNLTYQVNKGYADKWEIGREKRDTLSISKISAAQYYYYGYANGKQIDMFQKTDSIETIRIDKRTNKTTKNNDCASSCTPKIKIFERFYNNTGQKAVAISYDKWNKIESKYYYFYDDRSRLIEQIDSTGFGEGKKPYRERKITNEYSEKNRKETEISYINGVAYKSITIFDDHDLIISISDDENMLRHIEYEYKGEKMVQRTITDFDNKVYVVYLKYDNKGLLEEEKHTTNGKLVAVLRYFYE